MRAALACSLCALMLGALGCAAQAHRRGDGGPSAFDAGEADARPAYELLESHITGCAWPPIGPGLPLLDRSACDPALSAAGAPCLRTFPCLHHDECDEREYGRCVGSISRLCSYSDGRITQRECGGDEDCMPRPGGPCVQVITSSYCAYDDCGGDTQCAFGERCVCQGLAKMCLPADCARDEDCGPGRRCRPSSDCFVDPDSYHCADADDECETHSDCGEQQRCTFSEELFRCVEACPNPI